MAKDHGRLTVDDGGRETGEGMMICESGIAKGEATAGEDGEEDQALADEGQQASVHEVQNTPQGEDGDQSEYIMNLSSPYPGLPGPRVEHSRFALPGAPRL